MVAHAFLPHFFTSSLTSFLPTQPLLPEAVLAADADSDTVKVLDLLTNRYHTGLLRAASDSAMQLELPLSAHLFAGQRVRFIVAGDQPLVARHAMRGACITHVDHAPGNRLRVDLALLGEAEAAAA